MTLPSAPLHTSTPARQRREIKFRFTSALVLPLLAVCFLSFDCQAAARDVSAFFDQNCANCHGKELQGGQAPSLLGDTWKHGSDDASITHSISEGFPTNGMPAWKAVLNDAEIRAMVVLIREKRAAAQRRQTVFAKPNENETVKSKEHSFRIKTVAEDLNTPWSMAFLPDGRMLVTELPGTLRIVEQGKVSPPVSNTPRVRAQGQGGLLAVALHPNYSSNGWIYLSFSDRAGNGDGLTAVVRGRLKENQWADEQTIFRAPEKLYRGGGVHFGSRFVFDDAGHLFFTIGERGRKEDAQDLTRPNGKVHRVFDDGRVPQDNPFIGNTNAFPTIWSYGHRNPQGLARHPVTGELWNTEHGPRGGDELNLVQRGLNYGWPVITYGMDYNGSPISALTAKEGMEQPITYWTPSLAVCGITFYNSDRFPRWKNNLFVTSLAAQEFRRLVIDGHKVTSQEVLFKNIGRIRDVVNGPEGLLYIALNNPGKIIRLEPVP
ncbi:MAG: PQQ-dependent sugar dehydrogenase [Akkermansiaceae bacterium]|nr:PQQ-dependent sugar dehydrogenase [Verrucomicrobiales bacterium]